MPGVSNECKSYTGSCAAAPLRTGEIPGVILDTISVIDIYDKCDFLIESSGNKLLECNYYRKIVQNRTLTFRTEMISRFNVSTVVYRLTHGLT